MADSVPVAPASAVSPGPRVPALVLAAGEGRRLRPLTLLRPKPLCPMGGRTLLDHALDAVGPAASRVAVNVHHGRDQVHAHLSGRDAAGRATPVARPGAGPGPDEGAVPMSAPVHVSVEEPEALGTAGAVAHLADWLAGEPVLVVNGDTLHDADLAAFVAGWDGERVRLLTPTPGPFGPRSGVVASLLPASVVAQLAPVPSGLWECVWRDAVAEGRLDAVHHDGRSVDCGTPADYLAANLVLAGVEGSGSIVAPGAVVTGRVVRSVVGEGAQVDGSVERCAVWPGSVVAAGEHLVGAVRAGRLTVLVR
ncbi:MAG: sugar phosphate nucleotidyltransferase [Actinomycetes bacterium]